jgi:hypothetical protein
MNDHSELASRSAWRPAAGRAIGQPGAAAVRRFVTAAAVAGAAALALAGCAMVPASGGVNELPISEAGGGQNQENPQLIPIGPVPGWNPAQIVNGFLAASASFANDRAIALEYLTPGERSRWHPGGEVTVVGNLQPSTTANVPKRQLNLASQQTTVQVSAVQVATLTGSGQYLTTPSSASSKGGYTFHLTKINNQWRIDSPLPTAQLMLTTDELERAYQQRNLYFLDPSGQTLVPDPVFVPQNATESDLATQLVTGLLKDPQGWLSGATRTAFPAGTSPHIQVSFNGPDATVSIRVPQATLKSLNQPALAAQLVWTLTSSSYGPSSIQSVQLQVNGHTLGQDGSQYLLPKMYQDWVPSPSAAAGPYFISSTGSVRLVTAAGHLGSVTSLPSRPVSGQAGTAEVPALSAIAVSPDQAALAGVSANGSIIYRGELARSATLTAQRPSGTVTSLSWDRSGALWFAAGGSVWMLTPGTGSTVQADLGLPAGDEVTAFRVAPDGVRAAMIVKTGNGASQLLLAAIIHSDAGAAVSIGQTVAIGAGIADPGALSWYDADHIVVLAGAGSGAQLEEVPVNGGQPTLIGTQSGTVSVTGDGAGLAVGLSNGELFVSPSLNAPWEPVDSAGKGPVFPG